MLDFLLLVVCLRLVFASDGVTEAVAIRSVERYDLLEIKSTKSEATQFFAFDSVAYDPPNSRLSKSEAETEE